MNNARIPVAEYRKYVDQFNPTKFNADDWVKVAKDAGMKYIVITSKHHDGFAMFKSNDPFNIVDATPFKRDVIQELSEAARKQGLRFGLYYSQVQDWNHPGGYANGVRGRRGGEHWDPAQEGSIDEYLQNVAGPQVKEILTKYHPDILWWDTPGPITPAQARPLHELLALQPGIITNNRLGGGFRGDTETPEQNIPATGYPGGRDWETCMTINDTWGYKSTDTNFKSTETLLRNLIDIASKGGNYLLNVGPTAEGLIPQPEIDRLAEMGRWLEVNGEAIYGTGPNPFPRAGRRTTCRSARRRSTPWPWPCADRMGLAGDDQAERRRFGQGLSARLPVAGRRQIRRDVAVQSEAGQSVSSRRPKHVARRQRQDERRPDDVRDHAPGQGARSDCFGRVP